MILNVIIFLCKQTIFDKKLTEQIQIKRKNPYVMFNLHIIYESLNYEL